MTAHRSITRNVIREIGSSTEDPFAFGDISNQLVSQCFDEYRAGVEHGAAYTAVFLAMDQEYAGKQSIPPELAEDQVEDWLVARAVRAGLVARNAQDEWNRAYPERMGT